MTSVPDVLLSLDVQIPSNVWVKSKRSYLIWEYDKPLDVVVEMVSNREEECKGRDYARPGMPYYVLFDPEEQPGSGVLRVSGQYEGVSRLLTTGSLATVGGGVILWHGVYEGLEETWLRWCDASGQLLPAGAERIAQEHQRAERLAAQLRAVGIEPQDIA